MERKTTGHTTHKGRSVDEWQVDGNENPWQSKPSAWEDDPHTNMEVKVWF